MAKTGHNGHGNGHGRGHVSEIPDVSYIKNVDVTHEASDVSVSGLLKFVLALSIMTALVAVLMWGLFRFFNQQETKKEPPAGPMAMTNEERLPPEPRLQSAPGFGVKLEDGRWVPLEMSEPQAEFRVLRQQWESQLNCGQHDTAQQHDAAAQHDAPPQHASPQQHDAVQEHPSTQQHDAQSAPCIPIKDAMKRVVQQGMPSRSPDGMAKEDKLPTAASSGRSSVGREQ